MSFELIATNDDPNQTPPFRKKTKQMSPPPVRRPKYREQNSPPPPRGNPPVPSAHRRSVYRTRHAVQQEHERVIRQLTLQITVHNKDIAIPMKSIQPLIRAGTIWVQPEESKKFEQRYNAWKRWEAFVKDSKEDIIFHLKKGNRDHGDNMNESIYQELLTPTKAEIMVMIEKLLSPDGTFDIAEMKKIIKQSQASQETLLYEDKSLVFLLIKEICLRQPDQHENTLNILNEIVQDEGFKRGRGHETRNEAQNLGYIFEEEVL